VQYGAVRCGAVFGCSARHGSALHCARRRRVRIVRPCVHAKCSAQCESCSMLSVASNTRHVSRSSQRAAHATRPSERGPAATCERCRCARYVLRALGVEEDLAHTSIRIGIGRFTTEAEVDAMVELCVRTAQPAEPPQQNNNKNNNNRGESGEQREGARGRIGEGEGGREKERGRERARETEREREREQRDAHPRPSTAVAGASWRTATL
jgi:hypothetical protein